MEPSPLPTYLSAFVFGKVSDQSLFWFCFLCGSGNHAGVLLFKHHRFLSCGSSVSYPSVCKQKGLQLYMLMEVAFLRWEAYGVDLTLVFEAAQQGEVTQDTLLLAKPHILSQHQGVLDCETFARAQKRMRLGFVLGCTA